MKTQLKITLALSGMVCLLIIGFFVWMFANNHPDPIFNIGNNFPQTVTVYFNGHNIGKIDPGKSKIFYPSEITKSGDPGLLVELKTNSGTVLFSQLFTFEELQTALESVTGHPYWIPVAP